MRKTGIILLAAGESSRLGQPKQLLIWRGEPLIRHMALVALEADLGPVVVVLGAAAELCHDALDGLLVSAVVNPDWASGMGGSISLGVSKLLDESLDGGIVMLCDQPYVDAKLLRKLKPKEGEHELVASRFGSELGPPAWFSSKRFDRLLSLKGKTGAKSVIMNEDKLGLIDAPEAAIDIDTPEDWERLSLPKS